jgi:hypothetical protein
METLERFNNEGLLHDHFPFFYFSGRATKFWEMESYSSSPIGSRWLVLEPLEVPHVVLIMLQATREGLSLIFSAQFGGTKCVGKG